MKNYSTMTAQEFERKFDEGEDIPVDSKVLTPRSVGKRGPDKVVDSKKMTPAKERNADESKDSRRGVAAIEATVCREEPGRPNSID
jgi:hypothetical protein